jgi:hypothetical protein
MNSFRASEQENESSGDEWDEQKLKEAKGFMDRILA